MPREKQLVELDVENRAWAGERILTYLVILSVTLFDYHRPAAHFGSLSSQRTCLMFCNMHAKCYMSDIVQNISAFGEFI